jgi:phosphatidate cytidylyltransferase
MSSFYLVVSLGPAALILLTYVCTAYCYYEVMRLGHLVTQVNDMMTWPWLLFLLANFYLFDPVIIGSTPEKTRWLQPVCYFIYLFLIVWFVLSIRNTSQCLQKYCLLAWTHMSIFFISIQAFLLIQTLKYGIVWYVFSMSIITINDITAYMFGFFIGSTPLINLSPKKTWEGFIGGGITTVLTGPLYGYYLLQVPHLICPTSYLEVLPCDPEVLPLYTGSPSPFLIHCAIISLFASTLGPVAGFFCSGFKRACNQKNFGSLIPGHGGIMDSCDCMYAMASFIYVYVEYFIKDGMIELKT